MIPQMVNLLADGIGPEGLLLLGGVYFLLPATAVVVLEAVVLRLVLPLAFSGALKWSFWTNLISALAGIPFLWFFSEKFDSFVPSDLHLYFAAYIRFTVIRYLIYFALSVVVEFAVGMRINARLPASINWRRVLLATVLANAASYGLLSAPYYLMTRPTHTFARMTATTEWAADTSSAIFFIDPATNYLCRTTPTGKKVETVVPFAMSEYQLSPDLQTCVFGWNGGVYYYRHGAKSPIEVVKLGKENTRGGLMTQIALSPSGEKVAYTTPITKTNDNGYSYTSGSNLCVFDAATEKTAGHKELFTEDSAPALAWTNDEAMLVTPSLRCALAGNSATLAPLKSLAGVELCPNYGTFRHQQEYQVVARDHCTSAELHATVWEVLQPQRVSVSRKPWPGFLKDGEIVKLDDNPGVPILSFRRQYSDVSFLPGSSLVVLADETFSTLYLIDPTTRTIGKLISGRTPVLLTPKYQMKAYFQPIP